MCFIEKWKTYFQSFHYRCRACGMLAATAEDLCFPEKVDFK